MWLLPHFPLGVILKAQSFHVNLANFTPTHKKARETEWTKKHERHAHLELVHAFGECGILCKSVLGDITMIMSQECIMTLFHTFVAYL
jgi:hypothetical protein